MKLTNKLGLPEAIVNAVRNDSYSRGDADISITGLLRPPRIRILEEKHKDELQEDASDRIWSLFGQAIHTVLERANVVGVAERRLSMEVEGWTLSGGMDLYEANGTLSDYKMTSVWKVIKGDLEEWTHQLNLYSVLLRHHGNQVNSLQIVAILRDWSKMEAERDRLYPQAQVVNIPIELYRPEAAEKLLRERVRLHQMANLSRLPLCTASERWQRPDIWAVMKFGRKSAVKLYNNEKEANQHAQSGPRLSVIFRPGASVRCAAYCSVSKFCDQYQKELDSANWSPDEAS